MYFRFYPTSRWPNEPLNSIWSQGTLQGDFLGTWHFPTEIWIRFKQTLQIRQKLMYCGTCAINKSVSIAFLATPPYRKVHLKTIQSHALNKSKQNMQNLTGFSHQFLATGTCACSPQKLKFLCCTNQNIFISNGSFKTITNKIPTQSLAFLTFPFTFCINHFIPEQPSEQLTNEDVYCASTVHELCQWLQWASSNRKTFSPYPDTWFSHSFSDAHSGGVCKQSLYSHL